MSHTAYWLEQRHARAAHLHQRRRRAHLRQLPDRPGRASSSSSSSRSCSTTRRRTRSGTQFVNTAKWDFGRLIDGVFYRAAAGRVGHLAADDDRRAGARRRQDGPGDDEPGQMGQFRHRRPEHRARATPGTSRCVDRLPDGATGGMCDLTPEILSVQVFARRRHAGPGKARSTRAADYSLSYSGAPQLRARRSRC